MIKFVDPIIEKRDAEMVKMKEEGYSIIQIGKYFNLTKQRVSKILIERRSNPENGKD
jgi:hypothetical protein